MSITDSRRRQAKDKLGPLELAALAMVEDILRLLEDDRYLDMIEELVDLSDIDPVKDEEVYIRRIDMSEEKMMIRVARALLNMYTGRSDRVVRLATHGDPPPVDRE